MRTSHRGTQAAGACRRAACCALALAAALLPGAVRAQFAGTLGLDNVDRYRGTTTDSVGAVLRASAMADVSSGIARGAYAGVAGLWRTRDGGLASANAMLGWSGRLDELPGLASLSPDWGWDAGVHRMHYGEGARSDFSEAMVGLLAPGWALRSWFAPHYFGGDVHALYTDLDGSRAIDDHWHAFAHLGWLHYGATPRYEVRNADRLDTQVGIGWSVDAWDFRLSRDAIVAGEARADLDQRRRRAAWLLGASVAF